MALFTNTLEGGADGTTITQGPGGNSGGASGDFFTVVSAGTSGTVTFNAANAYRGSLCAALDQSTAGNAIVIELADTTPGFADVAARAYVKMAALPSATNAQGPINLRSAAASQARCEWSNTGQVRIACGSSTGAYSTETLAAGTYYRYELFGTGFGTASCDLTLNVYVGDSATVFATRTLTGVTTTTATIEKVRFGKPNTGSNLLMYVDDMAANFGSATPLGPTSSTTVISVSDTAVITETLTETVSSDSTTDTSLVTEISNVSATTSRTDTSTLSEGTTAVATTTARTDTSVLTESSSLVITNMSMSTFVDDFTTSDTAKWAGIGTNPVATGGRLSITPTSGYPSITSQNRYDLTGSFAKWSLPQAPNVGTGTIGLFVDVRVNGSNNLSWGLQNGILTAAYVVAGATTNLTTFAYSAVTHAHFRIRESGGTIFWETSADQSTWTQRASVANPIAVTALNVFMTSGFSGTEPTPGVALIDDFNLINIPASFAVTATGSARATVSGTASLVVTANATSAAPVTGTASFAVTATGAVSQPATGTASLAITATGTGRGVALGSGSLAITATGSSSSSATSTASLAITATGAARAVATGIASFAFTATGTSGTPGSAAFAITANNTALIAPATGTGSLAITASGSGSLTASGTASLALTATGTARGATTGSGSLAITATSSSSAAATATASFALTATASASLPTSGTASFAITATGTAAIPASMSTFTDDFTTADSAKWNGYGANPTVASGRLSITPTSLYPSITSVAKYNLTGAAFKWSLIQAQNIGDGSVGLYVNVTAPNSCILQWELANGILIARHIINASSVALATFAYVSATHAHFRIRESGGTSFWETSADQITWTQQASATTGFSVAAVSVALMSGYSGTGPAPGVVLIDDFNIIPVTGTASFAIAASGSGVARAFAPASLAVAASNTAVVAPATGSGSFVVTGFASSSVPGTGTASLALTATGTARAVSTGSGSFAITVGAAPSSAASTASASFAITANGTATSPSSATASLAVTATGSARAVIAGTAAFSISATGSASPAVAAVANFVITALGAGRGAGGGSASFSLSAAAVGFARATALAFFTIFADNVPVPEDLDWDADYLAAQRALTIAYIAESPTSIVLKPTIRVRTQTGGYTQAPGVSRPALTVRIIESSSIVVGDRSRAQTGFQTEKGYQLMAAYGATVRVGDTFVHDDLDWRVMNLMPNNEYEVRAVIDRIGTAT